MFKSFNEYVEFRELIKESGNIFDNVGKIKKEDIGDTLNVLLPPILKKLKLSNKDYVTLGSVGKKAMSGDIDILINGESLGGNERNIADKIPNIKVLLWS